ncbi:hypothetical protein ASPWEDRAFT_514841 [Aspergillus wentii DTO 134E9]|uniref:Secreted protein n=1 Tax=Aspergillus wentii DTO 134E9 TaxID=1073089 RepID=A0A1L9RKU7_ASPWE|nr:uncharacterized protein ASPWEDRAFT_514841 [Aspergillus wentii DTO 134E9]OJJ35559.1 hypothetical protein ASPWEDRAFT_514841 [Aspergillus wentii DTO 134E9]
MNPGAYLAANTFPVRSSLVWILFFPIVCSCCGGGYNHGCPMPSPINTPRLFSYSQCPNQRTASPDQTPPFS